MLHEFHFYFDCKVVRINRFECDFVFNWSNFIFWQAARKWLIENKKEIKSHTALAMWKTELDSTACLLEASLKRVFFPSGEKNWHQNSLAGVLVLCGKVEEGVHLINSVSVYVLQGPRKAAVIPKPKFLKFQYSQPTISVVHLKSAYVVS